MEPFAVFDCSLARCAIGQSCSNLRELLTALHSVPDNVLEHHMLRCPLEDHFELYEFPNDLARWCWDALGDHVIGEQLGLVDPYRHSLPCGPAREARGDSGRSAVESGPCSVVPAGIGTASFGLAFGGLRHGCNESPRPWRWPRRFLKCRSARCSFTYTRPGGARAT